MCERREYGLLSKRSKQILGEEVPLKDEMRSGVSPSHGSQRASDTQVEQKEKRRSQVLRAQRTHRQRTQTYIKMLEREVLRLRGSERSALQTVDGLQKQVDELLRILARSNTPPISATSDETQNPSSQGTVTARFEGNRGVYVNVQFPKLPDMSKLPQLPELPGLSELPELPEFEKYLEFPEEACPDSNTLIDGRNSPASNTSETVGSTGNLVSGIFTPSSTPPDEEIWQHISTMHRTALVDGDALLSDPRKGIEFVLTLETDCMDHLRGKHLDHVHESGDSESGISGHVTTASLSLWQQHTANLPTNASCQISNTELERLLSSSLNLGLMSPEITPVQIWNRIRWIPLPGGEEALQRLTRELKKHVFCVGFGAVLDDAMVQEILQQYFPDLPPPRP